MVRKTPERMHPDSSKVVSINSEVASLISQGCVLSTEDLNEIANKHGIRSEAFIQHHLGRLFGKAIDSNKYSPSRQRFYEIAGVRVVYTTYKHNRLLAPIDVPLNQTEWARITREIDDKLHQAGIKSAQTWQAHGGQTSRPRGPWRPIWYKPKEIL